MSAPSTRPRSRKPRGQVRVNFGHPLAKDIAFFYYYAAGGTAGLFYDAVTGNMTGTAASQTFSDGDLAFASSARSTSTAFQNPGGATSEKLTVVAGLTLTSKPASVCTPLTYGNNGAGRFAFISFDSTGFGGGGTSTNNGLIRTVDAVDHLNQYVVLGGSGDGTTGGTGKGWVNGVSLGSNNSGVNPAQTTAQVNLGRDASGYFNGFTGTITFAMGFNRILTDAEHYELAQNPWQILDRQQEYGPFSQPGGAPAGITSDLAYTETQDAWVVAGQTGVFASLAYTETQDAWNVSATVTTSGSVAYTETQDAWAISATVGTGITGDVAYTETQDSWAISASVRVDGSAAWTEGNDSWNIVGQTGVFGAGAWTETQDAWNIQGTTGVFAALAYTETQDAWNATGTVSLPSVTGDMSWTETQDLWNITTPSTLIDTHDGGPKRRKAHEKQKKKEEREYRELQERRRQLVIEAFEQVIEGKVSRETNIEQVIAPAAEYAVETAEIVAKSDFDFQKWVDNLANVERILDDYLERDDEDVLVLL